MCKCQECGKKFKVDCNIPNELWEVIRPANKPKHGGLLCMECIGRKIEKISDYSSYKLTEL